MKRLFCILVLCVMLCGCDAIMDGQYISIRPHEEQGSQTQSDTIVASNYQMLCSVMEDLVAAGTESALINVADYSQAELGMEMAVDHIKQTYPLGAYAVDTIEYEIGLSGGVPAISVNISYIHGRSELRKIRTAADVTAAYEIVGNVLESCGDGVVILIEDYADTDFAQLVVDFSDQNPHLVMETPQVAVGLYPEQGTSRVVELDFTYQTSRDSLRQMQSQVQPVFRSATLYVSGGGSDLQKYYQLYAFLMERYYYTIETSITPAYSLLCHGVGDSKAFAMVYSAMCRQAGLECYVITGTHNGEPWYWNMVCDDGYYYHVDLLRSSAAGWFGEMTDMEMTGYVWDYSAYPAASGQYVPPTEEPTAA